MKTIETIDYKVPAWALSALVTSYTSGIEEEADLVEVRAFEALLSGTAFDLGASHWTIDYGDCEEYFSGSSDFNSLGCNVVDCTVHFFA